MVSFTSFAVCKYVQWWFSSLISICNFILKLDLGGVNSIWWQYSFCDLHMVTIKPNCYFWWPLVGSNDALLLFQDTHMPVADLTWVFILLISFLCCLSLCFSPEMPVKEVQHLMNEMSFLLPRENCSELEPSLSWTVLCCDMSAPSCFTIHSLSRALTFVSSQNMRIASLRCIKTISHFPVHEVKVFNPPHPGSISAFFLMNWFVFLCTAVQNTAVQSFTTHCMIFSGAAVSGSSAAGSGSATGWQEETGQARGCSSQSRVVRCWKVKGLLSLCSSLMTLSCLPSRFLLGSPGGRWF